MTGPFPDLAMVLAGVAVLTPWLVLAALLRPRRRKAEEPAPTVRLTPTERELIVREAMQYWAARERARLEARANGTPRLPS